ncbi:MAG: 2-C-methyl-D-erythritol 4-phosphate cytidylyltransferase [Deltaproteobacteria bacterium]|nr:MAG: 2-C-methyl-D-erythritol 4-phosphate cytidylyltransferase [Deltaproteobacteria bacterium]
MRVIALIPAAGQGIRLEGSQPKQFLLLGDKPLIAHTLTKFQLCPRIHEIVLVVPRDMEGYCQKEIVETHGFSKIKRIVPGGNRRQDSVRNALEAISSTCDLIVIHDGVRPFVSGETIEQSIELAEKCGAVIAAVPARDSVKRVTPEELIIEASLDRGKIWLAQTPQAFSFPIIKDAYQRAAEDGFTGTDDAALVERLGIEVKIVPGTTKNIKITTPDDLALAEFILRTEK